MTSISAGFGSGTDWLTDTGAASGRACLTGGGITTDDFWPSRFLMSCSENLRGGGMNFRGGGMAARAGTSGAAMAEEASATCRGRLAGTGRCKFGIRYRQAFGGWKQGSNQCPCSVTDPVSTRSPAVHVIHSLHP